MDYQKFAKKYAAEIKGDFNEYDDRQSVIVVPLSDNRYQAVQGRVFRHEASGRERLQLKSTICKADEKIDFRNLLAASGDFIYCKFIIEDGFLRIEASAYLDGVFEERIKEMIQEAGNLADQWELKITGKDIF